MGFGLLAAGIDAAVAEGIDAVVLEVDGPRVLRTVKTGVGCPVPAKVRIREVRGVNLYVADDAVMHDGQQLTPRGQPPAGAVADRRGGVAAVAGVGRHGAVPVHGKACSEPQQAGDVVINACVVAQVGGDGSVGVKRGEVKALRGKPGEEE